MNPDRVEVTWCGREIVNPTAKFIVMALGIIVFMVVIMVLLILSPFLALLHIILIRIGRRGLILYYPDETYKIEISHRIFWKIHG